MKFISLSASALILALASCSSQLSTEEYLQRGADYMAKDEWKSAIIEYKNGIKQSPDNIVARIQLGKAYLKTFSSDAAIKELKKALELGADRNKVIILLGKAYTQRNKNEDIIKEVQLTGDLSSSEQVSVLAMRAGAFLRLNEPKKALAALTKGKLIDESDRDLRLNWAKYEFLHGTFEQQLAWLSPLLEKNDPDAWSQVGQIEQKKTNLEKAEEAFSKAINQRKLAHQDNLSRALVRIAMQKFDEAKEDLAYLKKEGLVSPVIIHSEGVVAFHQKDLDLAQSKFDEVLGKYKEFPPSLLYLGLTHFQKDNYESAIKSLRHFLKINKDNLQAGVVLSMSLLKSDKVLEAITELELLNKKYPDNAKVLSLLGGAYLADNKTAKGIGFIEKAVKIDPDNAELQNQLGSVLIKDKRTLKRGQEALLKSLSLEPKMNKANVSLYLSYMQSKDYEKAAGIAQRLIEEDETSLPYNLLATSYQARGDEVSKKKAMEIFNDTLIKFPSDPMTSTNLARIQILNKNFEAARSIYMGVLEKHPDHLNSLVSLAVIESKLGNDDEKIKYLKKAVESNEKVLSPRLILASEYLKLSKFKEAFDVMRGLSDTDNDKIEVQLIKTKAKMGLKDYDFALVLSKKMVASHPDSASAYFLLGQNYGYLKQAKNMRDSFEKVLQIQPDHLSASVVLTRLALLEGKKKEFDTRIKHLYKIYPDHPDVLFLYAKLESDDKDYKSAINSLEDLLKETPNSEIVIDIARNKLMSGDKDGAISGLELWVDKNPDDKKAMMLLAQFYISENRFESANDIYKKVDKLIPDSPIVLNNMAWLYRETDVAQGVKLAKKALSLDPDSPYIKDTLALLLLEDNKAEVALSYARQAAEEKPDFIEIQINYAKVLIALNKKDKAKQVLNSANAKNKSLAQSEEIKSLLGSL